MLRAFSIFWCFFLCQEGSSMALGLNYYLQLLIYGFCVQWYWTSREDVPTHVIVVKQLSIFWLGYMFTLQEEVNFWYYEHGGKQVAKEFVCFSKEDDFFWLGRCDESNKWQLNSCVYYLMVFLLWTNTMSKATFIRTTFDWGWLIG